MSIGRKSKSNTNRNRRIVYERDGGCVVSGSMWGNLVACGGGLTMQHRVTRGIGSSAKYDAEPNGFVAMCAVHNALEPHAATFRDMCERNGWSIRRSIADRNNLSRIPVRYPEGWYLLAGEQRFQLSDRLANEMMIEIYGDDYYPDMF